MNNSRKGLILPIIAIIVAVVIVGGIVYYLARQSSQNGVAGSAATTSNTTAVANGQTGVNSTNTNIASGPSGESDTQMVKDTVIAAFDADRNINTSQDLQNVLQQYYTHSAIQKVQPLMNSNEKFAMFAITQVPKTIPDPSSLNFSVDVNGDAATATASFATTTTFSEGILGQVATTTMDTVTISLQKESGQWKISAVGITI